MTLLSGHEYCRRGSFDWGGLSKKNKNDFPRELTSLVKCNIGLPLDGTGKATQRLVSHPYQRQTETRRSFLKTVGKKHIREKMIAAYVNISGTNNNFNRNI